MNKQKILEKILANSFNKSEVSEILEDMYLEVKSKRKQPLKSELTRSLAKGLLKEKRLGYETSYRLLNRPLIKIIAESILMMEAIASRSSIELDRLSNIDPESRTFKEIKVLLDNFSKKQIDESLKTVPSNSNNEILFDLMIEPMAELDAVIALTSLNKKRKENGMSNISVNLNCLMVGPSGTGKTTCSAKYAKDLYENKVTKKPKLILLSGADLKAAWLGQTMIKTKEVLEKYKGHTIMIDEFYSILQENDSYGQEAIAQLLITAEENRDDTAIILAGYPNEMEDAIKKNPGLTSRFRNIINFKSYTNAQLELIFRNTLEANQLRINFDYHADFNKLFSKLREDDFFGNAREVRNFFEYLIKAQGLRLTKEDGDLRLVTKADFLFAVSKFDTKKYN
jgi:SpoVK/Ycf46/Vps4 family AAA+-type ATPase